MIRGSTVWRGWSTGSTLYGRCSPPPHKCNGLLSHVRCRTSSQDVPSALYFHYCMRRSSHGLLVFFAADTLTRHPWATVEPATRRGVQPFLCKVLSDRYPTLPSHVSVKVVDALLCCAEHNDTSDTRSLFEFAVALTAASQWQLVKAGVVALRTVLEDWGDGCGGGRARGRLLSSRIAELKCAVG